MKRMPWTLVASVVVAAATAPCAAQQPRLPLRPNLLPHGQPIAEPSKKASSIEAAYQRLLAQAELRARQQNQKKGKPFRGFDWMLLGVATRVHDQGHAGSCWAHAGAEALEANVEIRTATFPFLSVQPVLDELHHSHGGTAHLVFPELMKWGTGLQQDYPYLMGKLNPRRRIPCPLPGSDVGLPPRQAPDGGPDPARSAPL